MKRKVALIRGINLGRAKRVAMADLRALMSEWGYGNVRTLLNSGNVILPPLDKTMSPQTLKRASAGGSVSLLA